MKRTSALSLSLAAALSLAACATPRTADNVTLARVAKDYIGVGSIDEMEIYNVQKLPDSGSRTNYRFFVDTARKKKFICDVSLAPRMPDGQLLGNDTAKCDNR